MANEAWQVSSPGSMSLVDLGPDIPEPGPKQALVRIQAVSLNYRDVLVVDHSPSYPTRAKPHLIPCSDGAGVVERAGSESRWKPGDMVIVHPNTWVRGADPRNFRIAETMGGGDIDGTLRRWLVQDDDRLVRSPESWTAEEACTLYTAGCTAWHALTHGVVKIAPGGTVLTMGTGGVSCYGIMIASAMGAEVVATSSSDEKLEVARKLGAKHLINYRTHPEWSAEVLKSTAGRGVDIVLDVVGASDIEQSIKATRQGGLVANVGVLSKDPNQRVDIMTSLLFGAKTIQAFLGAGSREMADEMANFVQKHRIQPPIAQVFEFEQADKALEAVTTLSSPGKIVIKV